MFDFNGFMVYVKEAVAKFITPMSGVFDVVGSFWFGTIIIVFVFALLLVFCAVKSGKSFPSEIKKPRTLSICAMLVAVDVVLTLVNPLQNINQYLRISFDCITLPLAGYLFGPFAACAVGIIQDIISYLIKPSGGFLFTYTICMGIKGLLFGMFLYKKNVSFVRMFLAQLVVVVFVHIILNSIALAPTVGSGLAAILPARIVKNNIVFCLIQAGLAYFIIRAVGVRFKK